VGFAHIFFKSPHQLFRGELGFDFTYDRFLPGAMPIDALFYSGRGFVYYENKFTPYASFTEGVELLEALNKLEHFRLNSITSLSSTISTRVSLKLNFTLKYNNDPPPRPPPNLGTFGPLDTTLEAVCAITLL
jgi:putative salt-induced outer membrane protein